ncbi:MAG: hypothetical protein GY717_02800 [Rhodobacteraceae bacterium]|nr:hypothetical protein [Paracoccaceae bacterium]
MGHIRLGTLARSKKWRAVIELLDSNASISEIAEAAARASDRDLARASKDDLFQFVSNLLVVLPHKARSPDYHGYMDDLGIDAQALGSVSQLLAGLGNAVDDYEFQTGRSSDAGEMAKAALLESLSVQLRGRLPTLFEPTPAEIRKALASFSSGQSFASLARDFFARLSYRSLDCYLSRELANHTGADKRFASDADRVQFDRDLAQNIAP